MNVINYDSLVDIRASKGIVKDYAPATDNQIVQPPNDYGILLDMFRNDPVLWTAIDLTTDMVTYNGFNFTGREDKAKENKRLIKIANNKFRDDLDFDQVMKNTLTQLLYYGDSFLYLKTEGGKVTEIHPLETTEMLIEHDKFGEIVGYQQRPNRTNNKTLWIPFTAEEVIYFRLHWIGSRVYSYSPFESTVRGYRTKLFGNDYLEKIFTNLPPKIMYFLNGANKEQRDNFLQLLIKAKTNPRLDLVSYGMEGRGKSEVELIQVAFNNGLIEVLDYLRREVLMVTRVPPHWIGMVEGTNRGIGENVIIPFETKVKKIQQVFASVVNKELMPRLGFSNLTFKFNAISLMDEKIVFENAQILKGLGLTHPDKKQNPLLIYLRSKGIQLPVGTEINEEMAMPKDSFPSRFSKDGKGPMGNELDKKGVSEAGGEKLEMAQEKAIA